MGEEQEEVWNCLGGWVMIVESVESLTGMRRRELFEDEDGDV